MKYLKNSLKKYYFYKRLRIIYRRMINVPQHPLQSIRTKKGINIKHFGTEYGGWAFVEEKSLYGSTIISAGLGEDASFDVEFAKKFDAKVIIVDPTPRAINHYKNLIRNLGSKKRCPYSRDGKQSVESYDLQGLTTKNFILIEKALWNKRAILKFFEPKNPQHVSHSIINYGNNYSDDTSYIVVETVPITQLIEELDLSYKDIPLIKLDIEGAEIEVIEDFLDKGFVPKQILVEFDELNVPTEMAFDRVDRIHNKLVDSGYECVRSDGQADFLYILSNKYIS